jgi:hypothetical protein
MNAEYVWWFVILVAVGVGVVLYLALGPVPEIPAPTGGEATPAADDDQSSPVRTTEPGPGEPSSTSETP